MIRTFLERARVKLEGEAADNADEDGLGFSF
jgi:hypothetical protein